MKKIYTLLMTALAAMTAMTFTACDNYRDHEDREEAYTLEGTWIGYIEAYIYDRYGLRGNTYRTAMYFERQNSYGGWGYEVDYDTRSPYDDYYYCDFRWDVSNGEIRIQYADSSYPVYIYDYGLNGSRFWGYMDDGYNTDLRFDLYYDGRFDWSGWSRAGNFTRAKGKNYYASGVFAKTTDQKASADNDNKEKASE